MGYITDFSLELIRGDEDEFAQFLKELAAIAKEPDLKYGQLSGKWYNWDKDMTALSQKYPNLLVQIDGRGEEYMDTWQCRYQNGEYEYHRLRFPEFSKLI